MYLLRVTRSVIAIAAYSRSVSLLSAVAVGLALSLSAVPLPASAQATCTAANADPDGDGWGWENNASCVVSGSAASTAVTSGNGSSLDSAAEALLNSYPSCSSSAVDDNGDGWGWENNRTCLVRSSTTSTAAAQSDAATAVLNGVPVCSGSVADDNGDGWGWENYRSCRFDSATVQASTTQPTPAPAQSSEIDSSTGAPVCLSAASDTNNDGWGFESGRSCVVTAESGAASAATSVIVPGDAPPPVAAAVPGFSNGNPICLTDASDAGNNGFGYENNRTCVVVNGVTATRNSPLLNQRSCIPWLEIGYGNYRLQNNTWNSPAVYHNNWSQCIELTGGPGNYVAKWDYNWLDRSQGNDFAVKSYPQVYYGRKTQYNLSGSVAETGLPVRVDSMPPFYVDYDYSETGTVERNVALESFFHNSCNAEEYNKQFEMMVWVGVPTIRTPGVYATTVTLSGQEWDVYTNPSLGWAYVAFVARQPSTSGRLNWNEFTYWSRDVGPSYGVPYFNPNGCMGAIEIGTETFWGTGTFTLNRFQVTRG